MKQYPPTIVVETQHGKHKQVKFLCYFMYFMQMIRLIDSDAGKQDMFSEQPYKYLNICKSQCTQKMTYETFCLFGLGMLG